MMLSKVYPAVLAVFTFRTGWRLFQVQVTLAIRKRTFQSLILY